MIVITQALTLDPVETDADHPLIGYDNIVASSNITSDGAAAGYPVTNLANTATYPSREWRGSGIGDQRIYVASDGLTQLDYVAIAGHNFGSAQIQVAVEAVVSGIPSTIAGPAFLPPDDRPVLFRFPQLATSQVRLLTRAGSAAPRASVMYVGKLLVVERKLWVGHTPLQLGRKASVSNGRSETGKFLGRVQLGGWRESAAAFRLISPSWYRDKMDDFAAVAQTEPFFFAWRPGTYPDEVGYAVLTDDITPVPEGSESGNLLAFTLAMRGIN